MTAGFDIASCSPARFARSSVIGGSPNGWKADAWWEERRGIIQPSEFVVGANGKVMSATYSTGPIGRVDAADVVKLINFYEVQARK